MENPPPASDKCNHCHWWGQIASECTKKGIPEAELTKLRESAANARKDFAGYLERKKRRTQAWKSKKGQQGNA